MPTPPLFVVGRFDQGSKPQTPTSVDTTLAEDLRHFFESPNTFDPCDKRAQNEVIRLAVDQLWLMCGCYGKQDENAPVLYGQRSPRGKIRKAVLVPLYARAEHAKDCPFSKAAPNTSDLPSSLTRTKKINGFAVLESLDNKDSNERVSTLRDNTEVQIASRQKLPTIARVLFTILDGAKVNFLSGQLLPSKSSNSPRYLPKRSVTADKDAIRRYIGKRPFATGVTLPASKGFEFSFSSIENLEKTLTAIPREQWGKFQPHGFLIDQVADYRRIGAKWELESPYKHTVEVDGRIYIPGENTPGPWLAICLVTQLPGDASPRIHRAYLHPLESFDSFILVDSDLERKTFAILCRKQLHMALAEKPYDIIKPVLDMTPASGDKATVRPDFIIKNRRGKLVVETMGYVDALYLERKMRTHSRMQKLEGVKRLYEHNLVSEADFIDKLNSFIG